MSWCGLDSLWRTHFLGSLSSGLVIALEIVWALAVESGMPSVPNAGPNVELGLEIDDLQQAGRPRPLPAASKQHGTSVARQSRHGKAGQNVVSSGSLASGGMPMRQYAGLD